MARKHKSANSILVALREIGKGIEENAVKALEDGANIIVKDAKSRINTVSGDLAESVHLEKSKKGTYIKIVADATNPKNDVKYGKLVEFFPGREHPFLYPAYDSNRDTVKNMVVDAIQGAVKNDLS